MIEVKVRRGGGTKQEEGEGSGEPRRREEESKDQAMLEKFENSTFLIAGEVKNGYTVLEVPSGQDIHFVKYTCSQRRTKKTNQ